jgi:HSP20 family molecular chaperone IbpA
VRWRSCQTSPAGTRAEPISLSAPVGFFKIPDFFHGAGNAYHFSHRQQNKKNPVSFTKIYIGTNNIRHTIQVGLHLGNKKEEVDKMVRRFHRSIYDELDELRASMDYLYQLALEPADNPLLPGDDNPDIVCQYLHNLNAEVADHDDEVTVTVDTIPGTGNSKLSVDLLNENTLKITSDREEERTVDDDGNCLRQRRAFSLHRLIPLPAQVMNNGAKLSLRNGVLDIHLKKAQPMHAKNP